MKRTRDVGTLLGARLSRAALVLAFLAAGPAGATVFTVNDAGDAFDASPGDGVCATAGNVCTLRAAVEETNALAAGAPHEIRFSGAMTIAVGSILTLSRAGTVVDGIAGNPAFAGTPVVEVTPSVGPPVSSGFVVNGGTTTLRGLVVRGFFDASIVLQSSSNVVRGCFVGTNAAGTAAAANGYGIRVQAIGTTGNLIGGTAPGDGNLISGNSAYGIELWTGATATVIQGNRIGVNAAGTAALPNGSGGVHVASTGVAGSVIGGATAAARNVISGHSASNAFGIQLSGAGVTGTVIQGNYIGTDVTGTVAIPNYFGIDLAGSGASTIGGSAPGEGNVVSGSSNTGIRISSSSGNVVRGNVVGLDATGTADLGNGNQGIRVDNSSGNQIGGPGSGDGNVISGNGDVGVRITTSGNTLVQGNTVGLDASGTTVVDNAGGGVHVYGGTGNRITRNRIASTVAGLAIDLDVDGSAPPDGVTPNDPLDADTGSNQLQNFPVLASAVPGVGTTAIAGTLSSLASTTFTVELFSSPSCHPSGNGDARTYLGAVDVTTDGGGAASIAYTHGAALTPGNVVTATATDPAGNTSELSACVVVSAPTLPDLTVTKSHAGTLVQGQVGATYTISVTNAGTGATTGTTTLVDTLPPGLTATAISGAGWSCTLATLTCTSTDVVPPAASFPPVTLTVNVAPGATGTLVNSVTVSGGGETNGANSSASDPATVVSEAAVPVGFPALALLAAAILAAGALLLRG